MKASLLIGLLALALSVRAEWRVDSETPQKIEFGQVAEGDTLRGEIVLNNTGSESVTIERVQTSCGCTAAEPERKQLDPGESTVIRYTLNTRGFSGTIRKTIHVYYKDGNPQAQTFMLQASVIRELELSPYYVHFRNLDVNPDTVYTEFVKIQNRTENPIRIHHTDYQSRLFKVVPESFVVPAGASHLVRIELTPRLAIRENATVVFETDYPGKPELRLYVYAYIKE